MSPSEIVTAVQNEEGEEAAFENPQAILPTTLPWLSYAFPNGENQSPESIRSSLVSCLPDVTEARRLVGLYFKHAAWMYVIETRSVDRAIDPLLGRYTPIPESEFNETVFSRFYGSAGSADQDPDYSHKLAVLYMALAMGSLLDVNDSMPSTDAARYYQLGRAALSLDSILEHHTIPAIQALVSGTAPRSTDACS